jgi:CheY-like chemotaxis protein
VAEPGIVLVIDDEAEVRQVIVRMLHGVGIDVVDAANGQDAVVLLDGGLRPAVIVLDLWMPIMDGWEFLAKARPTAPVIVLSGLGQEVHPLPKCVVKLLTKPVGLEELAATIRKFRDLGPASDTRH